MIYNIDRIWTNDIYPTFHQKVTIYNANRFIKPYALVSWAPDPDLSGPLFCPPPMTVNECECLN